jgi:hypothetical protein
MDGGESRNILSYFFDGSNKFDVTAAPRRSGFP